MHELSAIEQDRLNRSTNLGRAVQENVAKFVVAMIDIEDSKWPISTGTLLNVDSRLFVVTAAHCIPLNPNGRLLLQTRFPRKPAQEGMISFLSYGTDPATDVGFLELDLHVAQEYFRELFVCPLNRIRPAGPGRHRALMTLSGCPAASVDKDRVTEGGPAWVSRIAGYTNVLQSPPEWPKIPEGERASSENVDIFVEYPEEVLRLHDNVVMEAFDPYGFSGGGLWDHHASSDGVWSPEKATLFGVQSSWQPRKRYLRATQIVHWLRLIRSRHSELEATLDTAFPEIAA